MKNIQTKIDEYEHTEQWNDYRQLLRKKEAYQHVLDDLAMMTGMR